MMRRQIEARPVQRLTLNRLTVARLCSVIGGVALLIVLLTVMADHELTTVALVATLVGIAGISAWTVLAPADLRALILGRQARYGSNSAFAILLVIGIVTVVYNLVNGLGLVTDMTAVGYYSPKANIQPILKRIDKPILITAFYSTSRLNDQSQDMPVLQMFADAAPDRIKVNIIDPNENPAAAQRFNMTNTFGLYVSTLSADGSPDLNNTVKMTCPNSDYNSSACYANERWIAQAIAQLLARNKFKVLFSTGHNELSTDEASRGDAYLIRSEMQDAGIVTDVVDLHAQAIPADTSALVLLSPQQDFAQAEVDRIAAYLASGGKMILMTKPPYVSAFHFMMLPNSPMRTYLWNTWGLRPAVDIVYDPISSVGDWYAVEAAQAATNNPLTAKGQNAYLRPLFKLANSWDIAANAPENVVITALFTSSNKSYGKTDIVRIAGLAQPEKLPPEPGDLNGPLVLAATAENSHTGARIVVVGDSFWTINEVIDSFD
ncbi:MAG TPA: Gldg family protein, partial [Aggregatilineales bacterium]|nr:Gldg family protein [Aggregatilineales bacterium]